MTVDFRQKEAVKTVLPGVAPVPLIIAGEGGPSRSMVRLAAHTYQKEQGGVIAEVSSGDAFIEAVKAFVRDHGKISSFVYFGHGNQVGLFVNQEPGINGSVYANDPRLNGEYRSASIYELDSTVFATGSLATFYGCNIANNHPEETLASAFANYFQTTVIASTGPTEFSRSKDVIDRYPNSLSLPANFAEPVYMVPTFPDRGFIQVDPAKGFISGYKDVTENLRAKTAIMELSKRGLSLNTSALFEPYKVITYKEAELFCTAATGDPTVCTTGTDNKDAMIRNLDALILLMNALQVNVPKTKILIEGYISEAKNRNMLIPDFTNKRWLTRGEMAELTWNVLSKR